MFSSIIGLGLITKTQVSYSGNTKSYNVVAHKNQFHHYHTTPCSESEARDVMLMIVVQLMASPT